MSHNFYNKENLIICSNYIMVNLMVYRILNSFVQILKTVFTTFVNRFFFNLSSFFSVKEHS